MTKISLPNGDVPRPLALEEEEREALKEWLPTDGRDMNILESTAYWRNVYRAAEPYGPRLIALMIEAAVLEPEQDPLEAMVDLIKRARY
jgi:hypothetical protein